MIARYLRRGIQRLDIPFWNIKLGWRSQIAISNFSGAPSRADRRILYRLSSHPEYTPHLGNTHGCNRNENIRTRYGPTSRHDCF